MIKRCFVNWSSRSGKTEGNPADLNVALFCGDLVEKMPAIITINFVCQGHCRHTQISKTAVDLPDGTIALVNEVGVGTTFTVSLPLHQQV